MLDRSFEEQATNPPLQLEGLSSLRAERILIVDDEPAIRNILSRIVDREGFKYDTASHGKEAIQRMSETRYQLVLTDIRMPVMDGISLLQHILASHSDVAVIMVSAVADTSSAVDTVAAGAYDYITKPFSSLDLRNKILKALERRKLVLYNRQYQTFLEQKVQEQTGDLQHALSTIEKTYADTLETLISALDAREHETQRHSKRVSEYTLLIAKDLGIPDEKLLEIERGSLLHDIGKIGISDNILLKPGKLTEEEWVEMRKHPTIGYNILKGINFLDGAAQLVLQHHEKFDGTGYPRQLAREEILLGARVFAVVDTFDAMTSDRPYRKALSYEVAREEIVRFSGRQFDPAIVECFLSIPEEVWFETKKSLKPCRA